MMVAAMMMVLTAQAQTISGTWHGQLDLKMLKLNIVFHFSTDSCTLDSPDQGSLGIPCVTKELTDSHVDLTIPAIGGTFVGDMKEGKIVGTFKQMSISLPLTLEPGEAVRNRPQTPQPPYPYQTEEVTFRNEGANATFAGTLTYPVGYQPGKVCPVVLMVTGSGLQNRDEEIMGHKPFLVIADYLARHGIASLRYDDRGFGQSTGDVKQCTTLDFANDAEAGIRFLRSFQTSNPSPLTSHPFSKVGVLGHSEGGSIAFMLGARKLPDFIVALAAPGIQGDTLLVEQTNALLQLSGQPASMTLKRLRLTMAMEQTNPWYQFFAEYDPANDIATTECPVLALNGSLDKQVLPQSNLTAIRQHLSLNTQYPTPLIKEYPGLNHLFQHAMTGATTEYAIIEETIAEEVLQDIADWINTLVH